jgi:hypothetical protein
MGFNLSLFEELFGVHYSTYVWINLETFLHILHFVSLKIKI